MSITAIWFHVTLNNTFFSDTEVCIVNTLHRLYVLEKRSKPALIYHAFNISNAYATLNVQFHDNTTDLDGNPKFVANEDSRVIILVRHDKLPTAQECDMVMAVADMLGIDGISFNHIKTLIKPIKPFLMKRSTMTGSSPKKLSTTGQEGGSLDWQL